MKKAIEKVKSGLLILSWALYDLANQFFVLNVVSLYFVRWLTLEKKSPEILYSLSFGISAFFIALLSPLLGAIADRTGRHRSFLVWLTLLSVVFTMLLGASDNIFIALLFFAIANFGCQTAVVFYNALMVSIAPKEKIGFISGLGRMFGYSGAVVALYLTRPILLKGGYQATFLPTGLFFLIFALPCMIFVKDGYLAKQRLDADTSLKMKLFEILRALKHLALGASDSTGITNFLKASFFGLCCVNTIILFMSVYATRVFGLNEAQVINLVAFSTVFAIAGSFFSGFLSDYVGHKRLLISIFILWMICLLLGGLAHNSRLYWVIGALIGVALGSTWTVARALAMRLASKENIGEVFGLFNLTGYLSAIVGPLFWSLLLLLLRPWAQDRYRIALLSLILFMAIGFIFLLRIPRFPAKSFFVKKC